MVGFLLLCVSHLSRVLVQLLSSRSTVYLFALKPRSPFLHMLSKNNKLKAQCIASNAFYSCGLYLRQPITIYSRTSIIQNLNYPAWKFLFLINSENGRVPEMRMRIAAVTMETGLLIFCASADNHVALLFINKVGGSRRGLSIRLSAVIRPASGTKVSG